MKNIIKNISRILKNWQIALMVLAGVCAGGGNVWGEAYTYDGTWTPSEPVFDSSSLTSGDTIKISSNLENYMPTTPVDTLVIPSGVVLTVDSGVTFSISNRNLQINGSAVISGTLSTSQSLVITGTVTNKAGATITSGSSSSNSGTFINKGTFNVTATGFTNTGNITNTGSLIINNGLTNSGTITNSGELSVSGADFKNESSGTVSNSGTVNTNSTITNNGNFNSESGIISGATSVSGVTGTSDRNYIFIGPGSDWDTAGNWKDSDKANVTCSDNKSAKISLQNDCAVSGDFTINNSGTGQITILLNGHNFSIGGILIMSSKGSHIVETGTYESNIKFIGPGEVTINSIDTCATKNCTIDIQNNVICTVTDSISADLDSSHTLTISGDSSCTFYAPASGSKVDYGDSCLVYNPETLPKPYGEPKDYSVTSTRTLPATITFNKKTNDLLSSPVKFKYSIQTINEVTTNNEVWNFNGTTVSNESEGSVTLSGNQTTKNVTLSLTGTCDAGDGIIITIRTPDDTMDLAEIRFIQDEIIWTGTSGNAWDTVANWSGISTISDLTNAIVTIPAGCTNYPETGTVEIGTLNIANNARAKVSSGTLTVNKIITKGTGKIDASAGTVIFKGTDASWESAYPEYSSFGTLQIASSSTFTPESDVYITTAFDNASGGKYDAETNSVTTYLRPAASGTVTVSGNSADKIDTLDATNLGLGQEVSFNGDISIKTLMLSGKENHLLKVTGTGTITLPTNQTSGKYLDLSTGTIPTIASSKTYTIFDSTFPATKTDATDKGWIEGDPDSYIWLGTSTSWSNPTNWSSGVVPATGADVLIPSGCTTYPKLTTSDTVNVASIIIESGASLDFNDQAISTSTSFTLNGTIILNGSENFSGISGATFDSGYILEYDSATATYSTATKGFLTTQPAEIIIDENAILTLDEDLSFGKITNDGKIIVGDGKTLELTGSVTGVYSDSGDGIIELDGGTLTNSGTAVTINKISLSGTDESTIDGGTNGITITTAFTAGKLKTDGKVSLEGELDSLNIDGGTTSLTGTLTVADITLTSGSTLNANNKNITVSNEWDNTGTGTFTPGTNTVTFSDGTITGDTTTFDTVAITGNVSITGSNTFESLTIDYEKTVTFAAGEETTVTNAISLSGVTLTATAEWTLTVPTTSTFTSVSVTNCNSTNSLTATTSTDNGGNVNWNFEGEEYTWTGEDSTNPTNWTTASNWSPASVPGNGTIITIPVSCPNYPVLTEPTTIGTGTLTVAANASLDLGGFTFTCKSVTLNGTLKIKQNEIFSTTSTNTFGTDYILDYYDAGEFDDTAKNFFPTPNIVVEAGKTLSVTTTSAPTFNSLNNSGTVTLSADLSVTSLEQASGAEINAGANNLSITSVTSDVGKITLAGGTIKNTTAAITLNQIDLSSESTSESTIDGGTQGITISTGFTTGSLIANNKLNIKGTLTKLTANSSNVTLSDDLSTRDFTQDSDSTINVGTHTFTISGTVSDEGKIAVSSGTLHNSGSSSITIKNLDLTGSNAGSPATINGGTGLVITSIPNWGHILSQGSVSLGGSLNTLKVDSDSDLVTLTANTTIGTLTNNGKVDGAYSLTLTNAVFCSPVGYTTPLTSLSVSGTTTLNTGATSITTTGAQTYTGAVTIDEDTNLQASTVTFSDTVTGTKSLAIEGTSIFTKAVDGITTLDITGNTEFNAPVGSTTSLSSLSVSGTTALKTGATSITTTGAQTYTGAVTIDENTTLQASTVTFSDTVTGTKSLAIAGTSIFTKAVDGITTLDITGDAEFNALVGSTTPLASLSVSGTTALNTNATSITTTGTQTYTGQLTTAAPTTLTATGSDAQINTDEISSTGNLTLAASQIESIGAIAPTTNNTDTLTFESTNVTYTSLGTSSNKYALVKIGLNGSLLELAGDVTSTNTQNIYATQLQLIGSSLTTSNITFDDELIFDTTGAISMDNISANTITLPNGAASISFKNVIEQNTGDFTIDYPATLAGDTIFQITSGKFILDDTTTTQAGSINPSDSTYKLTLSASNGIELNNDIAETTKLAQLTINNNLSISKDLSLNASKVDIPNGSTVILSPTASSHTLTITDNLFNAGSFTSNDNIITKSLTNEGSFTANADIYLSGDFKDTGTWISTSHKDIILNSSTANQSFSPKTETTYYSIKVDKHDASNAPTKNVIFNEKPLNVTNLTLTNIQDVTFNKNTTITNFTITNAENITFYDISTITSYTDTANTAALTFKNSATFKSDVTFNCPNVTFDGSAQPSAITASFNDGTADTSLTQISGGKLTLKNANLNAAALSLDTVTADGNITSSDTVSATKLTLTGDLTATNAITLGTASVTGTITTSDTFDATTFTLSGTLSAANAITLGTASVNGTIKSTSSTISTSETTTLTGDTTYNAFGNISFTKAVTGQHKLSLTGNDILFNDSVNTTDQDITITSAKCTFNNTVTGGNLSINNSNLLSIADISGDSDTDTADITVTSFTQTPGSTGAISISGDITATTDNISISNAIHLLGDVKLSSPKKIEFAAPSPSAQKDITSDPASTYKLEIVGAVTNSRPTNIHVPLNITGSMTNNAALNLNQSANISGDVKNDSTLAIYETTNINGSLTNNDTFTNETGATLNIIGNLNNNGTFTAKEVININGDLTNAASKTFTAQADISIAGNFTDAGTWDSSAGKTIFLNKDNDQTFTANSSNTYFAINENKTTGKVTYFTNTLNVQNFSLTSAPETIFNVPVVISTYNDTSNTTATHKITFNKDATFKSNVIFNTPNVIFAGNNTVTFNDGSTNTTLTHTSGTFSLAGDLTAAALSLDTVTATGNITSSDTVSTTNLTLTGNTKYKAAADITFANNISGAYQLTLDTPANINIKNISINELVFTDSTIATPTDLSTSTAQINLNGNIITTKDITFPFNMNITGESTIECPNAIFLTYITLDLTSNPLTINAYTLFNGTLNGNKTLSINDDLIFNSANDTDAITINTPINCAKSIVLYSGDLQVNSNITANNDILLYGTAYKEKDEVSGIEGIYKYNDPYRESKHPQINFKKTTLPDGTSLPSASADMHGKLSTTGAVTIKAAKNFYANGLTATGDVDWNLILKSNKNTVSNFAEAFYCDFTASPCKVLCYDQPSQTDALAIAAESCTVKDQGATLNPSNPYETCWDLEDFIITQAYTVHDNLVCIEFNHYPKTIDSEIENFISRIEFQKNSTAKDTYKKAITDDYLKNFTTNLITSSTVITLDEVGKIKFYICTQNTQESAIDNGSWNSDADGISAGRTYSNDTHNKSHNNNSEQVIPYLNIPRNIPRNASNSSAFSYFITDVYGKRLLHYYSTTPDTSVKSSDNGKTFTNVSDRSKPVIIAVKTGQELHEIYDESVGEASQHSYDSHNFIEFIYSESVNIGSTDPAISDIFIPAYDASGNPNIQENVRVTNKLGALTGDITKEGKLTFAGIGTIDNGKIHTGINGTTDATANAFYRDNPHSVKISIAGWTDGTITDRDGNDFKKWVGYIENAKLPNGNYILGSTTPLVFDLAGNAQKDTVDVITVNSNEDSSTNNVYGVWDISEPVFAPCRLSVSTIWGDKSQSEAVGAGSGSTLDRIEFHIFDNTPDYSTTDPAFWFTQKGWCKNIPTITKPELFDENYTYCADIIGGARQYDTNANRRTKGGIRFSTKASNPQAFKYTPSRNGTPTSSFLTTISGVYGTTTSTLFTGSSSPRRSNTDPDGLYLGLGLPETNLPVETTFTVSYDDSTGFLTDLAGNRLRSDIINTIDRTPPSIDLCLSEINKDELLVIFVKELNTDASSLKFVDQTGTPIAITHSFEQILPYCFEIVQLDSNGIPSASSDLKIDTSKAAKVEIRNPAADSTSKSTFTFITLKLNRTLTLKDLQTLHVRLRNAPQYPEKTRDPITSIDNSRVTFFQDIIGNYTSMYTAHSLSDFILGGITPLYAYDADMTYNSESIMDGFYEAGSWAVHDWEANQQNYGKLPANHPISLVVALDDGTAEKTNLPANARVYLANSPDSASIATQFNADFNHKLRVWLPDVSNGLFPGFALSNNTNYAQTDSELLTEDLKDGLIFNISKDITTKWNNNDQISFLFGLLNPDKTPMRIYNAPYFNVTTETYDFSRSTAVPLYSLRLHDPSDILSLELWSFRVRSITEQRAGVSILNNVINSDKGEKTVVKVNMPSEGKLSVMVMTLDGNIVQYLTHGDAAAGEHYYAWDGKNKNGKAVARGMYFIRIVGNGIDETRKVMVVK